MNKILIVGTLPPPIGGVTIHLERLCEQLKQSDLPWAFIDFKRCSKRRLFRAVLKNKIIHLHSSNVYVRLLFSLLCLITVKKLLITYHGDVGRYGKVENFIDYLSIRATAIPIVINNKSLHKASAKNKQTVLARSFIPPAHIKPLDSITLNKIRLLKKSCDFLFCTNAFNVGYDKNRKEVYQITDLVRLFNTLPDKGLIVSDPSGNYFQLLMKNNFPIHSNILFLSFEHDFNSVISESDCMIRYTTTDGDSISIKEALMAGKPVIASNVVDRPEQVILTDNDIAALEETVEKFKPVADIFFRGNGFNELYNIYYHEIHAS